LKSSIAAANDAEETLEGGERPTFDTCIRFDKVNFDYDQHRVFRNLCLQIEAGSLTTLVGPSGSGKTTIVDLTIALLRPQAGVVSVDGVPMDSVDIKHWRSLIGYVPQDTVLLHDTVLHNITLGDPELRPLVNQPRLLILDEATSALDPDSEAAVRQTMESLKGQLTILAISHNRAMVQAADHVYQMEAGSARLLDEEAQSVLTK
jgi:ATP-binding cassette subfamily C protein